MHSIGRLHDSVSQHAANPRHRADYVAEHAIISKPFAVATASPHGGMNQVKCIGVYARTVTHLGANPSRRRFVDVLLHAITEANNHRQ